MTRESALSHHELCRQLERALSAMHCTAEALDAVGAYFTTRELRRILADVEKKAFGPASRPDVSC